MNKNWTSQLRNGDKAVLKELYIQHQQACLAFIRKQFHLSESEANDIYQDSVLALYENVVSGKLQHLESSVRTYLLAISKNLCRKRYNKIKYETDISDEQLAFLVNEEDFSHEEDVKISEMEKALDKMGEPCFSILNAYYYQNLGLKAIAEKLGYQSANVVKTQKSRCMKQLRKAIKLK